MNLRVRSAFIFLTMTLGSLTVSAQVGDICAGTGALPSMDSPFAHIPYVFGKITLVGFESGKNFPKVTIYFSEGQQTRERWSVDESGNYCFKRKNTGSGSLSVEINGIETAQRTLPAFGPAQQREDFEIHADQTKRSISPGVLSAKFSYPANPKTEELYKKASESEKDLKRSIQIFKEIVSIDPADFIAWAKLGSFYFTQEDYQSAVPAFRRSLELRIDYTPAWISVGLIRVALKQFDAAIEIFKHAANLEPSSARIFRLLGESYLQNKQGTLGAESLNKAIEIDPIGMAECHIQLAHLYQLAKANSLAAREYRLFLEKIPNHPDKKKFQEFIKKNPE